MSIKNIVYCDYCGIEREMNSVHEGWISFRFRSMTNEEAKKTAWGTTSHCLFSNLDACSEECFKKITERATSKNPIVVDWRSPK